jgi:pimeloyl-ACP methyl ester carboxylesterase
MKTSQLVDYEVFGAGTPIVFLHGMALNKESNRLFFEPFLRTSDYQRIYLDIPGMGASAPTSQATGQQVAETLFRAIREIIGEQSFVFYGHSFGGYMAQVLTEMFAGQVIGLFLTGSVVTADKSKRLLAKPTQVIVDKVEVTDDAHYYDDFLTMSSQISQANWETYRRLIVPGLKTVNHAFLQDLHQHYTVANEDQLRQKNYRIPLTMMIGKNDQVVGYQEQCQLAEQSEGGELFLLSRTGHNVMIDRPVLTKLVFQNFLTTVATFSKGL